MNLIFFIRLGVLIQRAIDISLVAPQLERTAFTKQSTMPPTYYNVVKPFCRKKFFEEVDLAFISNVFVFSYFSYHLVSSCYFSVSKLIRIGHGWTRYALGGGLVGNLYILQRLCFIWLGRTLWGIGKSWSSFLECKFQLIQVVFFAFVYR